MAEAAFVFGIVNIKMDSIWIILFRYNATVNEIESIGDKFDNFRSTDGNRILNLFLRNSPSPPPLLGSLADVDGFHELQALILDEMVIFACFKGF